MTKQAFKSILVATILPALFCSLTHGQRPLDIDEIKVVAPYEPSISDAFKININPSIEDTVSVQMDFDYSIIPRLVDTRYELEPITPARMRGEPIARLYPGLIRGGFGNYQTPYFEGFYNTLRSGDHALGVHMKHLSSGEEVEGIPHSIYSHNLLNVHGTRFLRNVSLKGGILYDRQVVHYYGIPFAGTLDKPGAPFMPVVPPTASDIRQRYELLSSHLGYGSHHADSANTLYRLRFNHQWLSDRYDIHEHLFRVDGKIGRETGMDPFGIAKKQYVELALNAEHYYNRSVLDTSNAGVYTLSPQMHSQFDRLHFYLGGNIAFENDRGNFVLRAYPLAGMEMQLVPGSLVARLDIWGGLERQSWKRLSDENPFVMPGPTMEFSNIRSRISAGVHGSMAGRLSYDLRFNHSRIDNYPLFVRVMAHDGAIIGYPGMAWSYPFVVVYDDLHKMHLQAQVSARFGQRLMIRLRGDWYDYDLGEQARAWHKPSLLLSFNASYNIQDKIILTADLYGRGESHGVFYESFTQYQNPTERKLHDFYVDANLGVEYRYTRRLSVFLNFTNLVNDPYEKWITYPVQSFGFLGGLSFAF